MRHPSKTDLWLAILIWGGLALAGVVVLASADPMPHGLRLLVALSPALVTTLLIYPLYYEIGVDDLKVRCGLMRYRIPGRDIVAVAPSRNPASSPAMSLDRLAIRYQKDTRERTLLISPMDKAAFLSDLRAIAPHLKPAGDSLAAR